MVEYKCPVESCKFSTDNCRGVSSHLSYHDENVEYPTKEMLLSAIKNLQDSLDRVPTFDDMKNKGEFSATLYYKRFGSWSDAVNLAGFDVRTTPTGEESPHWTGGKTKFYKTESGEAWRKAVFQRDEYTCQDCGDDTGGNLNAHHIKRRSEHPKYELMVWNGVTLCKQCHIERHKDDKVYSMMKAKVLNTDKPNN